MGEVWDVYDRNKKKTGKFAERDMHQLQEGEYHIVVNAVIMNSKNEILVSRRAAHKKHGLLWELSGGSIVAGETSLEGMLREVREELGLQLSKKDAVLLADIPSMKHHNIKELWLFRKDIDLKDVFFSDGEAIDAKWVTIDEFEEMVRQMEMTPTVDFGRTEYEKALKAKQRPSYQYIGKEVSATIDRPMHSKHPTHGYEYPINYGYIPNTTSGDGEELDCYVLGVNEPIESYTGDCIAVIHRIDDDDDKLIIVPKGRTLTDEEIRNATNFQEQYFESEIIR